MQDTVSVHHDPLFCRVEKRPWSSVPTRFWSILQLAFEARRQILLCNLSKHTFCLLRVIYVHPCTYYSFMATTYTLGDIEEGSPQGRPKMQIQQIGGLAIIAGVAVFATLILGFMAATTVTAGHVGIDISQLF